MTAKDKRETGKTPAIRDLQDEEIDSTSGAAAGRAPSWIDPDPLPVQNPKTPGWVDPDSSPIR